MSESNKPSSSSSLEALLEKLDNATPVDILYNLVEDPDNNNNNSNNSSSSTTAATLLHLLLLTIPTDVLESVLGLDDPDRVYKAASRLYEASCQSDICDEKHELIALAIKNCCFSSNNDHGAVHNHSKMMITFPNHFLTQTLSTAKINTLFIHFWEVSRQFVLNQTRVIIQCLFDREDEQQLDNTTSDISTVQRLMFDNNNNRGEEQQLFEVDWERVVTLVSQVAKNAGGIDETEPFFYRYLFTMRQCSIDLSLADGQERMIRHVRIMAREDRGYFTERTKESGYSFLHYMFTPSTIIDMFEPVAVFQAIIDACPEAVSLADNQGYLPLHLSIICLIQMVHDAPNNFASCVSVCKLFLVAYPEAACIRCAADGMQTPFHLVVADVLLPIIDARYVRVQSIKDLFQSFLQLAPDCTSLQVSGMTPLHLAISKHQFQTLISLPETDCRQSVARYFIQALATRKAALTADHHGVFPLHVAIYWKCEWMADTLIAAAPQVLEYRCMESKLYPFQAAAMERQSSTVESSQVNETFRLLCRTPNLVSTALLSTTDSYLQRKEYIQGARMELFAHRLYLQNRADEERTTRLNRAHEKEMLAEARLFYKLAKKEQEGGDHYS